MSSQKPNILLLSCCELGHQPHSLASPLAALAQAGLVRVQNKPREFLWVHEQIEEEY